MKLKQGLQLLAAALLLAAEFLDDTAPLFLGGGEGGTS